jgi:hypothetical protein
MAAAEVPARVFRDCQVGLDLGYHLDCLFAACLSIYFKCQSALELVIVRWMGEKGKRDGIAPSPRAGIKHTTPPNHRNLNLNERP